MITPRIAPVPPRASGSGLRLDDELRHDIEQGAIGAIEIVGGPGEGKTVALRHLRAVFSDHPELLFIDEPDKTMICAIDLARTRRLVIYAARKRLSLESLGSYRLASWTIDDAIEYVLAVDKPRCESVVSRLKAAVDLGTLGGNAALWRIVLDEMIADDQVVLAREAIGRRLDNVFANDDLRRNAELFSHAAATKAKHTVLLGQTHLGALKDNEEAGLLLRLPYTRCMLAADHVLGKIAQSDLSVLELRLPADLIAEAGAILTSEPALAVRLAQLLLDDTRVCNAMAASLFHAARTGWRPLPRSSPYLVGGYFAGANWSGLKLSRPVLREADFSRARLMNVHWKRAVCSAANFSEACLLGANLVGIDARKACFVGADLAGVEARWARFSGADFTGARLNGANLGKASFADCNLAGAQFIGADLSEAKFKNAVLDDADFTRANLKEAHLCDLVLFTANFTEATFEAAEMDGCELDGLSLPGANFSGADLEDAIMTGTHIPGGNFQRAILYNAGLAEIDWEGANLRNADLREATFHMGSSRSGLVGSPIASEGSRTGFYTDDFNEQDFKSPEEIRKANLRGADLRGANIEHVDFYLVDLRDALYDNSQARHFRSCGAILETRV